MLVLHLITTEAEIMRSSPPDSHAGILVFCEISYPGIPKRTPKNVVKFQMRAGGENCHLWPLNGCISETMGITQPRLQLIINRKSHFTEIDDLV